MNSISKNTGVWLFIFLILLGGIVGMSYKKNPYFVNIQYQSAKKPKEDGVEKIIVSHVEGVRRCTWEDFEYNVEKDRYEYVVRQTDNTYLNLYLNPFETFRCNLEYRLKYENSVVDPNDRIIITLYSGNKPVRQQIFPLLRTGINREYQSDLYMTVFLILFFLSFIFWMVCGLKVFSSKPFLRLIVGGTITGIWSLIWFICTRVNATVDSAFFNRCAVILLGLLLLAMIWSLIRTIVTKGDFFRGKLVGTVLPEVCFYVITCCVYVPSSLFLSNINEFAVPYYRVALPFILYAVASFLILLFCGVQAVKINLEYVYGLVVFFLTLCFYVQSNFLNPVMPNLNGGDVDWTQFTAAKVRSSIGWGSLIIIMLVLIVLTIWKKIKFEKPIRYLSILLCLMQVCSLLVLIITCPLNQNVKRVLEKEGQFIVGEKFETNK